MKEFATIFKNNVKHREFNQEPGNVNSHPKLRERQKWATKRGETSGQRNGK